MKHYLMMFVSAGILYACNTGRETDGTRDRSPMEARNTERSYDTPEMSGDHDAMREPIDRVHPPGDGIPYTHEIQDDSLIAPIQGGDGRYHTGSKANEAELEHNARRDTRAPGAEPVMPADDGVHHSPGGIGTVEGAPAGTTHVPITEQGVHQTPGAQHMSQDGPPVGGDTTNSGSMMEDSLHHQEQIPQQP
jgi:hypothetical protein